MSKRYTFYLRTKEKTHKFNSTWARGRFIDEVEDEEGTCKGVCYYKDNETGEVVIQYCMFDNGYKNEEERLKAFREYFKDILPELEVEK